MLDKIIDWLFGVITRPVGTLAEIARERPVGWALLVYAVVIVLTALSSVFSEGARESLDLVMQQTGLQIPAAIIAVMAILAGFITLFITTLILNLLARLFGGKGSYGGFLSAYAFAIFPMIINVPTTFIMGFLGGAGNILGGLISFGLSIWVLVLQVLSIRESHMLSTGMSILAYIIYLFVVVLIPVTLVILLVLRFALNS